jgi:hypothetical protein
LDGDGGTYFLDPRRARIVPHRFLARSGHLDAYGKDRDAFGYPRVHCL